MSRALFGSSDVIEVGSENAAQLVQKIKLCLLELGLRLCRFPNAEAGLRVINPETENVSPALILRIGQSVNRQTNREKCATPESGKWTRNLTNFCHE